MLLDVDVPLEPRVRAHDAQVRGLAGDDQRHVHVGVAGKHGETHAAQEDQQVPVIQERLLDVLAQAHVARSPTFPGVAGARACSRAGALAFLELADQVAEVIDGFLESRLALHLLGRTVRRLDLELTKDCTR